MTGHEIAEGAEAAVGNHFRARVPAPASAEQWHGRHRHVPASTLSALCAIALACGGATSLGTAPAGSSSTSSPSVSSPSTGTSTTGSSPAAPAAQTLTVSIAPPSVALAAGTAQAFTASVTGTSDVSVTWQVSEGSTGGAIDASGLYTAPSTAGTYHVVAASVADPSVTASATVIVTSAGTVPPASTGSARNLVGMNVGIPNDYDPFRIYADIARVMRVVQDGTGVDIHAEDPRIDSTGMPLLTSFRFGLAFDPTRMDGRYRIRFTGKVTSLTANADGTVTPTNAAGTDVASWALAYDGTYTYARYDEPNTGAAAISLVFSGAYRDSAGTQPGVAAFSMMRPVTPGSTTSYALGTLFTNEAIAFAQHFDVLRWMQWLDMNGTQVQNWTDRGDPRYVSSAYQPAIALVGSTNPDGLNIFGSPTRPGTYEDIIRFSNAAGVDPWINVPLFATGDDFYLKLAQLFKCGSDGMNPWIQADSVTCATGTPPFPPLDPARKLYVEYSNEVWNFGFSQWTNARDGIASYLPDTSPIWYLEAPIPAWNSAVAYGAGETVLVRYNGRVYYSLQTSNTNNPPTNTTWWAPEGQPYRLIPLQLARISLAFRRVFGDSAMMTRIRPVLAGQSAWPSGPQGVLNGLGFIFDYFSNGGGNYLPNANWTIPGTTTQVGPQPVSYYFWGGGGAGYYTPSSTASSINDLLTSGEFTASAWSSPGELQDTAYPPLWGLVRAAYEGGPNYGDAGLAGGTPQTNAGAARYAARPASPNMTDVMEGHHDYWSSLGGGLLTYFTASSGWQYGGYLGQTTGTDGIFSFAGTPQMTAVDELRGRAPAAITVGTAVPATVDGNTWLVNSDMYGSGSAGSVNMSSTGRRWAAYLFRADSAFTATTVALSWSGAGAPQVYVDGAPLTSTDGGTTWTVGALAPGLHGVIVRAASGAFTLNSVSLQ